MAKSLLLFKNLFFFTKKIKVEIFPLLLNCQKKKKKKKNYIKFDQQYQP